MRPADLPKPVRKRAFRESLLDRSRAEASPGPARYSGAGVTAFERNTKLGTFSKDQRFRKEQLVPEDSYTKSERANAIEGAGPKYSPKFMDTRLATSFSTTSHLTRARESGTPGPGAYTPELSWDRGVTIPNSYRRANSASATPGPGAYTPSKPPIRTRAAFFGGSGVAALVDRADRPPLASLDAIDRSMLTTRAASPSVSFTKAERRLVISHGETNPNGAGAYDVDRPDALTRRSVRGGKFSTARRMPNTAPDTDGRLVALPPADLTSTYGTAPSISFGKASPLRGVPLVKESVPTAKYNPKYTAVDASVKGVVGWGQPKAGGSSRTVLRPSVTSNADFMDPKSSFDGPTVSFPESRRPAATYDANPGPGAYTPTLTAPKREPRAAGFSKAKRDLVTSIAGEATPGPIYNPDVSASRPPVAPEIAMARSHRTTKFHTGTEGADAMYDLKYAQTDKNSRSAILYLTE